MTKIAVLDDWQGVARNCADWSALEARAAVTFFREAFGSEDLAAQSLAPFDIILSMRERTAFPAVGPLSRVHARRDAGASSSLSHRHGTASHGARGLRP